MLYHVMQEDIMLNKQESKMGTLWSPQVFPRKYMTVSESIPPIKPCVVKDYTKLNLYNTHVSA